MSDTKGLENATVIKTNSWIESSFPIRIQIDTFIIYQYNGIITKEPHIQSSLMLQETRRLTIPVI